MSVGNFVRSVCLAVLCTTAGQVKAGMLSATDRGFYMERTYLLSEPPTIMDSGSHSSSNLNYQVGSSTFNGVRDVSRSFFVFDVSGLSISETITSASLRLKFSQAASNGNFTIYDISTGVASLTAGGSNKAAIFADLGTGTSYGTQAVSSADLGSFVTINLDAAGLSALNAARGGSFLTGGAFSGDGNLTHLGVILSDSSLVYGLSTVPEPTTMVMFGIGAVGMGLVARRRKKQSNAE